ncbi:MAG: cation transporter [Humidesulfovibrio sp.]|nr:cation transporter [Humidesulfovibrio sp.]
MPTISVKGMSCNHCVMSVTKALEVIPGVAAVKVDLLSGKASFEETAPVDLAVVKKAIEKIGFEVVG